MPIEKWQDNYTKLISDITDALVHPKCIMDYNTKDVLERARTQLQVDLVDFEHCLEWHYNHDSL